jgi:hypothetical protein
LLDALEREREVECGPVMVLRLTPNVIGTVMTRGIARGTGLAAMAHAGPVADVGKGA